MTIQPNTRITVLTINGMISRNSPTVCTRARPRVQTVGLFLLIMPLMVSTVIRVFGWIVILGRKGLVNQTLVAIGLEPVKLLYTETAVVVGLVNIFLPFMVLPIMASIERIPPN